jgi:hypothetical protein
MASFNLNQCKVVSVICVICVNVKMSKKLRLLLVQELREVRRFRGQFFKRIFAPRREVGAYAANSRLHNSGTYALVGAYARVGAYTSYKKLASGANEIKWHKR